MTCTTNFSHAPLLALCRVLEQEGVVIDFSKHWQSTSEKQGHHLCQKCTGRGKVSLFVSICAKGIQMGVWQPKKVGNHGPSPLVPPLMSQTHNNLSLA